MVSITNGTHSIRTIGVPTFIYGSRPHHPSSDCYGGGGRSPQLCHLKYIRLPQRNVLERVWHPSRLKVIMVVLKVISFKVCWWFGWGGVQLWDTPYRNLKEKKTHWYSMEKINLRKKTQVKRIFVHRLVYQYHIISVLMFCVSEFNKKRNK